MLYKSSVLLKLTQMGCCSCFGFTKSTRKLKPSSVAASLCSQEFLLNGHLEDSDADLYKGVHGSYGVLPSTAKCSENILSRRAQNGMICRGVPVNETHQLIRSEDENGDKMVNEYVRVCKIGSGSYGKVVLYKNIRDGKQYAIKAFHKSHLLKLRVAPSETAMTDVLREVSIMKTLEHPNIVNLVEVIDDPNMDNFYMVLEYVESKWVCQDSDPPKGLDETTARRYLRGIVAGIMYLHAHNIIYGDIKPDNLLITSSGTVKIGDFSVSQGFEIEDNTGEKTITLTRKYQGEEIKVTVRTLDPSSSDSDHEDKDKKEEQGQHDQDDESDPPWVELDVNVQLNVCVMKKKPSKF